MSDNTATAVAEAPAEVQIPTHALEKKDEQGNLIASVTPVIEVIQRGEAKGNPYPVIKVTKDNFQSYVKFRGSESVIDDLNAIERQRAQGALDYSLKSLPESEDPWEEIEPDKETGKPRFKLIISKFLTVLDKFYETLTSGKVRSGETIESLNEDKALFLSEMNAALQRVRTARPDQIQAIMQEAAELSTKYQECEGKIEEIRKSRTPRKTKAQKAQEEAAAKAAAVAAGTKAA